MQTAHVPQAVLRVIFPLLELELDNDANEEILVLEMEKGDDDLDLTRMLDLEPDLGVVEVANLDLALPLDLGVAAKDDADTNAAFFDADLGGRPLFRLTGVGATFGCMFSFKEALAAAAVCLASLEESALGSSGMNLR